MNDQNNQALQFILVLIIVGVLAFAGNKYLTPKRPSDTPPAPTPAEATQPPPPPVPVQPVPTPAVTVQPTLPPPTPPPIVYPTAPIPTNAPPGMKIDEAKIKELAARMQGMAPKQAGTAKDFNQEAMMRMQRMQQALTSEQAAREALKDLEACASQPDMSAAGGNLPGDTAKQMAGAQQAARASCRATQQQILQKYPSLRK